MSQVVPLANLIVKENLSEEDVLTCQKTVYNLVEMERKNDPLPISTVGSRGKGPKRLSAALIMAHCTMYSNVNILVLVVTSLH